MGLTPEEEAEFERDKWKYVQKINPITTEQYNHQGLAAVLSALLPGLGQVYNGQGKWALFYFVLHCGLLFLLFTVGFSNYEGILFIAVLIMINMIQSATSATISHYVTMQW